jgi:hypothetical protein
MISIGDVVKHRLQAIERDSGDARLHLDDVVINEGPSASPRGE